MKDGMIVARRAAMKRFLFVARCLLSAACSGARTSDDPAPTATSTNPLRACFRAMPGIAEGPRPSTESDIEVVQRLRSDEIMRCPSVFGVGRNNDGLVVFHQAEGPGDPPLYLDGVPLVFERGTMPSLAGTSE